MDIQWYTYDIPSAPQLAQNPAAPAKRRGSNAPRTDLNTSVSTGNDLEKEEKTIENLWGYEDGRHDEMIWNEFLAKFEINGDRCFFGGFLWWYHCWHGKKLLVGTKFQVQGEIQDHRRETYQDSWSATTITDQKRMVSIPIGSMYGIYGNVYHQYTPNVSIYAIHGSYGICLTPVWKDFWVPPSHAVTRASRWRRMTSTNQFGNNDNTNGNGQMKAVKNTNPGYPTLGTQHCDIGFPFHWHF